MRVLFVAKDFSVRTIKLISALQGRVECSVFTPIDPGEFFRLNIDHLFKHKFYQPINATLIKNAIEICKPDLIHSYGFPDSTTVEVLKATTTPITKVVYPTVNSPTGCRELREFSQVPVIPTITQTPKIPVVHECADFTSGEIEDTGIKKNTLPNEIIANRDSDAVIYLNKELESIVQKYTGVKKEKVMYLPNYSCIDFEPKQYLEKLSKKDRKTHLVYVGGLNLPTRGGVYSLAGVFKEVASKDGYIIHVYPSHENNQIKNLYKAISPNNIRFEYKTDPITMSTLLTQYDYGMCLFNPEAKSQLKAGLPNKFFDYYTSGLPILTNVNAPVINNLVKEYCLDGSKEPKKMIHLYDEVIEDVVKFYESIILSRS